jgi:hypothetical protein
VHPLVQPQVLVAPEQTSNGKLDALLVKASAPGATQADVENAVDGIFAISGLDPEIASMFSLKTRIVAAELAYHNHNHSAVPEASIVGALNGIANQMNLPDYAHTSNSEVRKLHVALIPFFPKFLMRAFVSQGITQSATNPSAMPTIVQTQMSPLETALLFTLLIHQKLTWSEYQMTPAEYAAINAARHSGSRQPLLHNRTTELQSTIMQAAAGGALPNLVAQTFASMNMLGFTGGAQ